VRAVVAEPDAERGELLGDLEVVLDRVRRAVAESA
jgi:hypothetical protein